MNGLLKGENMENIEEFIEIESDEELFNEIKDISRRVSNLSGIAQNTMVVPKDYLEDLLSDFYRNVNDINEDLVRLKHKINDKFSI